MPCYHRLEGWRSFANPGITFNFREACQDQRISVPCGKCIGCRLEISRQWAVRSVHEASLYSENCFVTLTYSPEFLPEDGSLDYEAPVLWMKRLREKFGSGIRSFGCAEYGEKYGRPHYHVALFNFDFPDKEHWKTSRGFKLFNSNILRDLWPYGHSVIADLSFESAAYVARYVTKKFNGVKASETYHSYCDLDSGDEIFLLNPEKGVCIPQQVGLGRPWYDKFKLDVYPSDFVVVRGVKMRPPRYYDRLLKSEDPDFYRNVKRARRLTAEQFEADNTDARLLVKEKVQLLKFNLLMRGYENGT